MYRLKVPLVYFHLPVLYILKLWRSVHRYFCFIASGFYFYGRVRPKSVFEKKKRGYHRGAHSRFNHSNALGSLTNNGDTFSQISTWYLFNQTFSTSDNKVTSTSFVWIGHLEIKVFFFKKMLCIVLFLGESQMVHT